MLSKSTLAAGIAAGIALGTLIERRRSARAPRRSFGELPSSKEFRVRVADAGDVQQIAAFVLELARFEELVHEVVLETSQMSADFTSGHFECLIAERDGQPAGMALFFHNYSTFEGLSMYLEDLYVSPEYRGRGCGKLLLQSIASVARHRRCARLQWQALSWNEKAVTFYKALGARERRDGETTWLNFIMGTHEISTLASDGS